MRLSRLKSLCLAASFLAAAACTSASSSKVDPACAGTGGALASAGPDRLVSLGETVELAGGAFETSGQPSYLWRLESIPPLSRAALTVATAPGATFVADQAGVYVASLSVRDACGPGALDVVTITVPGAVCVAPPPVADAGPNQALSYRTYLVLDGGASHASVPGSLT